jgi:hypothetical protein
LDSSGALEVQTLTVDDVVASHHRIPALMKIDVEGSELDVLLGAERTLTEVRPMVLIATHSAALKTACTKHLVQKAYRVRPVQTDEVGDAFELIALPDEDLSL